MIRFTEKTAKGWRERFLDADSIEGVEVRQDNSEKILQCVVITKSGREIIIPQSKMEDIDAIIAEKKLDLKKPKKKVAKKKA